MTNLSIIIAFLWLCGLSVTLQAQVKPSFLQPINNTAQFARFSLKAQQKVLGTPIQIQRALPFSSMSISSEYPWEIGDVWIVEKGDTIYFSPDIHGDENVFFSRLEIFPSAIKSVTIQGGIPLEKIEVQVYYAPRLPANTQRLIEQQMANYRTSEEFCGFAPQAISQAIWREGLTAPATGRDFAQVKHLIVHHSAGKNNDDDHLNTLRNIYLFHTNGRGWSDIGYNYIIADDGTLYTGRDPEGGVQDNVIGAHFCAKNTGTMGVCVLGNYEEIKPSQQAVDKLKELLVWKAEKEGIDPLQTSVHKDVNNLVGIGGHRDGCSTACPGTFLYNELPTVREFIRDSIDKKLPTIMLTTTSPTTVCEGEEVLFTASGISENSASWQYVWEVNGGTYQQLSEDSLILKSIDKEASVRLIAASDCQKSFYQQLTIVQTNLPSQPMLTTPIDTLIADDIPQSFPLLFESIVNSDTLIWTYSGENIFPTFYKDRVDLYVSKETTSGYFSFYGNNSCGAGKAQSFYVTIQKQPEQLSKYIYPNPVEDSYFYFHSNKPLTSKDIQVIDVNGKFLSCLITPVTDTQWKVDVSRLGLGLYRLLVDQDHYTFVRTKR